jgi:WD40 repeat protein
MRAAVARWLEATPECHCAPPPIPDHKLLHQIGSGAYGDVWLARSALGTLRAVKVVYRVRFKEDRPYEREFHGILKYEPISRTHEGLVQVLHVGRNDEAGCFYYVMELADEAAEENEKSGKRESQWNRPGASVLSSGLPDFMPSYRPRTLRSDVARQQHVPPMEAAQLVLRLAGALGHLHAHELVHRDVKPSNVIFIGGQPKLADIGLVTDVGSSHSFVGTEGFIPPEGPGTPQADLYGLGKLLYELATGRDRMDFPQLPTGVKRLPDCEALLELNEVMTRACAPEPGQRYASAKELQADLNLFLAGRSLRRARNAERYLTQLKRFAATACAFLVLAGVAVWFAKREERHANERERLAMERAHTERRWRERAEMAELESRQQLYTALLEQARATVRSGELGHRVRALEALRRAAGISNTVELRREVFAALALPDLRFEREFSVGPDATLIQLDPTFEHLAVVRGKGPVEIRSAADQRLLSSLAPSTNLPAYSGKWSDNGRYLGIKRDRDAGGRRADLEVWDVVQSRRVLLLRDARRGAMSFHPHLPQIIIGGTGDGATVWDLENAREVAQFALPTAPFNLRYSPDGHCFAIAYELDGRGIISVHDAADAKPLMSQVSPSGGRSLEWHPRRREIAVGGDDGSVNLINSQTGERRTLGGHKAQVVLTVFSPDGKYLVSGGWEREFICWDVEARRRVFTAPLESFHLQFRADGRECAVRTGSWQVQFHAFERPVAHREFAEDLGGLLRYAAFSPDGRWLAASAADRLGVWDLNGPGPGALASEGAAARLFFNAAADELFASRDDDCFCWRVAADTNIETAPKLQRLELPKPRGFNSLCVISNRVAMTGAQGTRLVVPGDPGAADGPWTRTSSGFNGVSLDGQWLGIYRPFTPSLYVYRLPGLERVAKLTHPAAIGAIRFSPLGDEVAIASRAGVEFWSTTTWQPTRLITNFMGIVYAPDSHNWWLTQDLRTAGLYDAHTLEPLLPLPMGMLPLALSSDGRRLVVSVDARRLQVWDIAEVRERLRELSMDWKDR